MNAYYTQIANEIFPIYGVSSIEEAKRYIPENQHQYIVETDEDVYMNPETGSVGFESDWDDLEEVVKVEFNSDSESWEEAK